MQIKRTQYFFGKRHLAYMLSGPLLQLYSLSVRRVHCHPHREHALLPPPPPLIDDFNKEWTERDVAFMKLVILIFVQSLLGGGRGYKCCRTAVLHFGRSHTSHRVRSCKNKFNNQPDSDGPNQLKV